MTMFMLHLCLKLRLKCGEEKIKQFQADHHKIKTNQIVP